MPSFADVGWQARAFDLLEKKGGKGKRREAGADTEGKRRYIQYTGSQLRIVV